MEVVEEVAAPPPGPTNKDLSPIAKGKRTKRHRPHSPIPFTITPPVATTAIENFTTTISAASSEESTTTEEVDTARCLLLLSQGHFLKYPSNDPQLPKSTIAARQAGGSNACIYTCKTCNRSFPSFQALGGHRASHKKPKNEKKSTFFSDEEDFPSPTMSSSKNRISSNSLSLQLSNISTTTFSATPKSSPSPRIHECSYCGAEFTSGQALGGHMRKHRSGPVIRSPAVDEPEPDPELKESKKAKNGLSLDLNLPAPEDENQRFGLGPNRDKSPQEKNEAAAGLGLSTTTTTPSLVDCHY